MSEYTTANADVMEKEDYSGVLITEKAAGELREIMKSEGMTDYGVRVAVIEGGCSGYKYALDFANEAGSDDRIFESNGMLVFIDNTSYPFLKGLELDYTKSLEKTGFVFSNPNAVKSCGCGSSFSA